MAGSLWAMRGLVPTRPRAAGFSAGLLAGSVGAFGYSLSCPEAAPAFVAIWHTLGIALTGAVGAPRAARVALVSRLGSRRDLLKSIWRSSWFPPTARHD